MRKDEAAEKIPTVNRNLAATSGLAKPIETHPPVVDVDKAASKVEEEARDKIKPLQDATTKWPSKSLTGLEVKQDSTQTNYDPSGRSNLHHLPVFLETADPIHIPN